jgi:hypothetical protein
MRQQQLQQLQELGSLPVVCGVIMPHDTDGL